MSKSIDLFGDMTLSSKTAPNPPTTPRSRGSSGDRASRMSFSQDTARRRTFAIVSHRDVGKTIII